MVYQYDQHQPAWASMQIHASLSRAFLQGSFDICILNTTSKDTKLPRGKAARHTLCLEMDYG